MKVSVVTVCLDAASVIADCLDSVREQTHPEVEHWIIDGGSRDGTVEVIQDREREGLHWISQPDQGVYDALNRGIARCGGELVALLHGDDRYEHPRVLERVVERIQTSGADSCYGDVVMVQRDAPDRIRRYWSAGDYRPGLFRRGWMPPHPTLILRRRVYELAGGFDRRFRIAGDYEFMLRLFEVHRISTVYLPEVLVRMRLGGISNRSLSNLARKSWEDRRAWKVNGLPGGAGTVLMKNLRKVHQLFLRPRAEQP